MTLDNILVINASRYVKERSIMFALDGLREVRPTIRYYPPQYWNLVNAVAAVPLRRADRDRNRVVVENFIARLDLECEQPPWTDDQGSVFSSYGTRLVIMDERLCGQDGASIMGASARCGSNEYAIISDWKRQSDLHDMHVIAHELGHVFGAPTEGRQNTADVAGLHCASDLCVMRNQLTPEESHAYAQARHLRILARGQETRLYCDDCSMDIVKNSSQS